jgi:hypothetical protein
MRRTRASIALTALLASQGCYVTTPLVRPSPETGEVVVLQISDRGRVALADRLGAGVSRIQGRVQSASDDLLSLRVASVGYVSGETDAWSGETVTINREYVGTTQLRRFSRSRTWVAVGVTTLVAGSFIASRGLRTALVDLVSGSGGGTGGPAQ